MNSVHISVDPNVMMGKPVISGTRITIELLLERLAAGESREQIHEAYPHLPPGSIDAALGYAAAAIRNETVVPMKRLTA
jgi:uncharacterized protein (DUF433 family)